MSGSSFAADIGLFVSVVETGSFSAAAEASGLTPSAVSKAITRMEDRLGVKLLERTTRRLALTQEGETMLARGRDILAALEAAEAEVTANRGKPRGLVKLNTGTAFARHRLAPVLPLFRELYPEISLDLSISDRRIDVIAEQIDIAIRTGPLGDSTLIARKIGDMQRVICASPEYIRRSGKPEVPADLLRHNCLLLQGFARLAQWPMRVDGRTVLMNVRGSVTTDSAELLLDLALAGVGIVRFGNFLAEEALASGRLVSLLEEYHLVDPQPITALIPPGRQDLPRIRAVVDFLTAHCGGQRPAA
ncbi:MAG: LysR family transcriptional regulator [Beijerinckiaceae bacterium]